MLQAFQIYKALCQLYPYRPVLWSCICNSQQCLSHSDHWMNLLEIGTQLDTPVNRGCSNHHGLHQNLDMVKAPSLIPPPLSPLCHHLHTSTANNNNNLGQQAAAVLTTPPQHNDTCTAGMLLFLFCKLSIITVIWCAAHPHLPYVQCNSPCCSYEFFPVQAARVCYYIITNQ